MLPTISKGVGGNDDGGSIATNGSDDGYGWRW